MLNFPELHPALAPALPSGTLFFDPGLNQGEGFYLPPGLPMDPGQAKGYLEQMEGLGREAARSRGGLAAQALGLDMASLGLDPELAAIKRFVRKQGAGEDAASVQDGAGPDAGPDVLRCQSLLLLAYQAEAKRLELAAAQAAFSERLKGFHAELGPELAEAGMPGGGLDLAGEMDLPAPPWRLVLSAMLALAPDLAELVTGHPETAADLRDRFDPAEATVSAPAWRVLGATRPPEAMPWLRRDIGITLVETASCAG